MKLRYAATALAAALLLSVHATAQEPADQHIINLSEADISALIDDVATLTGYTFVVHPDVRGKVTVNSQTALSKDAVFQVFLSTLRVQGYTAVPDGRGVYRIVPEQLAAGQAGLRRTADNAFITEVFSLNHFNAVEAAKLIKPLLGPNGDVVSSPATNLIIAVDYASNMDKVRALVGELDVDNSVTRTVALRTMPADEMANILNNLGLGGVGVGQARRTFSAIGSNASNAVIIKGDPASVEQAAYVIDELDSAPSARNDTRVISLSHSDATLIEPILQQVATTFSSGRSEGAGGPAPATISVHQPTNSLVISADVETLSAMERVIKELDVRRKQVLVEALIVDISDNAARELGVQFVLTGTEGNLPFASSTFSDTAPNVLGLTGALLDGSLTDPDDPTPSPFEQAAVASLLGLNGLTLGGGGQSGNNLFGAVLTALEEDTESNVLSTPSVLTQDNEPALLSIGQEIPITSGQVLGDANANPFLTVERQDIGVILTVTPRVGDDNTIRLEIDQEVSSVAGVVGDVTPDFILNRSQIQTNVLADDGDLIVLGGLIQDEETINISQVPILGDIPGLGKAFRTKGRARAISNLVLFIRATIVADKAAAQAVTARSYNYLRAQQILSDDGGKRPPSIDAFVSSVLDETPPPPPPYLDLGPNGSQ